MKTSISTEGLIRLPDSFLLRDAIQGGQTCEIQRESRGVYRIEVKERAVEPNEGLVDLLLSCPVKDFFTPAAQNATTDDLKTVSFE